MSPAAEAFTTSPIRDPFAAPVRFTARIWERVRPKYDRHLDDLRSGWLTEGHDAPKHKGNATLASLFGADTIPTTLAVKVNKAIERLIGQGQLEGKARWKVLERWADAILASGRGEAT